MFKRLQKNNRIENVRLEENTKHFIDGFKKLVEQNNQPTINRLIKFMANSVQGDGDLHLRQPTGDGCGCSRRFRAFALWFNGIFEFEEMVCGVLFCQCLGEFFW